MSWRASGDTLPDYRGFWEQSAVGAGNFRSGEALGLRSMELASFYTPSLYRACSNEYKERTYNFCGPFNMLLGHIISEDMELPLSQDQNQKSRLQLYIHRMGQSDDQTSLVHHVGDNTAIIMDGVIRLIKAGAVPGRDALHVDWISTHDLEWAFANMDLRPLRDKASGRIIETQSQLYPASPPYNYEELVRIMHSPAAFHDSAMQTNGQLIDLRNFWGPRLRRIYMDVRRQTGTTGPLMRLCQALR